MMRFVLVLGVTVALAACAAETGPPGTSSPRLDSGVTSSGGGGTQTLGNTGVSRGFTAPAR